MRTSLIAFLLLLLLLGLLVLLLASGAAAAARNEGEAARIECMMLLFGFFVRKGRGKAGAFIRFFFEVLMSTRPFEKKTRKFG